jgi:PAS domain S-box-containing protein
MLNEARGRSSNGRRVQGAKRAPLAPAGFPLANLADSDAIRAVWHHPHAGSQDFVLAKSPRGSERGFRRVPDNAMRMNLLRSERMEKGKDGIWIIDSDARTTYINQRMAEILGVCPEEILGVDSMEFIFPEDLKDAQRLFENKKSGDVGPFHFRLRRKDGSGVWVHVQGTPMYNAAGAFNGS